MAAVADAVDASADAPRGQEALHILQQGVAAAAEPDVAAGLAACLDSRHAAVGAEEASQECGLHLRSGP